MTENQKKKVYLSKSNQADPSDVGYIRRYLQDLGYEIVEHSGGPYEESLLGTCAYMVMVGWDKPDTQGQVYVGKGQYTQFRERRRRDFHYNYYVTKIKNGKPTFRGVTRTGAAVNQQDWSRRYGVFYLKMDRSHSTLTVIAKALNKKKGAGFNTVEFDLHGNEIDNPYELKSFDGVNDYVDVNSGHLGGGRVFFKNSLAAIHVVRRIKL